MNVQVDNIVNIDKNHYRVSINGKTHHILFFQHTSFTQLEVQIFDENGVGTTGIYDGQTNSLHDSGLNVALLNVVDSAKYDTLKNTNAQVGGANIFTNMVSVEMNQKLDPKKKKRKSRRKKNKRILTMILALLISGGAVLQQLGNTPEKVIKEATDLPTPSGQFSPVNIDTSVVLPQHILNPIIETATVSTFLHNIQKLSNLIPGVVPEQDVTNIINIVPVTEIPTIPIAPNENKIVTLSNTVISDAPVLQSVINETSAHTQCLVNTILTGEYPSISKEFVTNVENILDQEKESILNSFTKEDAIIWDNLTNNVNKIMQPFEQIGETIYHSAKYNNMTSTMVQELVDVVKTSNLQQEIQTPKLQNLIWSTVKNLTESTLDITSWILETQYVHVTQPVLSSIALLGNVLLSPQTANLFGTLTSQIMATSKGITYFGINVISGQWEYISKPIIQTIPTVVGVGLTQTSSTLVWTADTGSKVSYRYIAQPSMEAVSAQYRYITKPMLSTMWDVVKLIATPPMQYEEYDESILDHAKEILENVKQLCGSLYEMASSVEWSVKSTENVLHDNQKNLKESNKEMLKAETRFLKETSKNTHLTANLFRTAEKNVTNSPLFQDIDNLSNANKELNTLWNQFRSSKPPTKFDEPIADTSIINQYVINGKKEQSIELQDLQILSPATKILQETLPVNLVPLEILPISSSMTAMGTPESTVIVANTPIILKETRNIQSYSKNDPFNPANTPVASTQRAVSRAKSREKIARQPILRESVIDNKIEQKIENNENIQIIIENTVSGHAVVIDPITVSIETKFDVPFEPPVNPLQKLGEKIQETNGEILINREMNEIDGKMAESKIQQLQTGKLSWWQYIQESWNAVGEHRRKMTENDEQNFINEFKQPWDNVDSTIANTQNVVKHGTIPSQNHKEEQNLQDFISN
jgi:hypothetical protein